MVEWKEDWQLKFEDVTKVFDNSVTAVDDVNFFVKKREFFTILGPSGSGKTTMLRMIAGFENPTSGEIYLNKMPLTSIPSNRRPVNTVFQNYALFPHMNVYQNIAFGLSTKRVPVREIKARVSEVLDQVSLSGYEKRFPEQLSGGQQQRVALARALVCKPEILLSDESLGALDLKLRRQTQIALKQIQSNTNITFIHVTHDQEEAFMMSDRIIVANEGRIEQIGSPMELYDNPSSLFVGGFIGENNLLKIKIDRINEKHIYGLTSKDEKIVFRKNGRFPDGLRTGEEVLVLIRPEKISISNTITKANSFNAQVKEIFLSGSEIKVLLRYSEEENIMLKLQTDISKLKSLKKGETVNIGFEQEDVVGIFR